MESAVKSLVAMGHEEDKVRKALQFANNDIVKALEYLAKGMPPEEKSHDDDEEEEEEKKLTILPNNNTNGNHNQINDITQNMQNMTLNHYNNNTNNTRYEWEWSSHGGSRWHRYSDEVNKILNNNLFVGKSIQINMNGNLYEMTRFDDTTATQRNKQTNKVRNVRRKEINEIVDKFAIQRIIDIIHCTENEARDAYIKSNRDEERAINYIFEQASKPKKTIKSNENMEAYKSIFNEDEEQEEDIEHIYGFSDDDNVNNNNNTNKINDTSEQPLFQTEHIINDKNNINVNGNNDNHQNNDNNDNNNNEQDNEEQNNAQSAAAQAAMNRYNDSIKEDASAELNDIDGNENDDDYDSDYLYGQSEDDDNDINENNNNGNHDQNQIQDID